MSRVGAPLAAHRNRRPHASAGAADLYQLGQKSAIQFVDYVLEKLPFHVQRIQTDNGSEFQAAFHWRVLDRGTKATTVERLQSDRRR